MEQSTLSPHQLNAHSYKLTNTIPETVNPKTCMIHSNSSRYALSFSSEPSRTAFAGSMVELVTNLAKALVDKPEEVVVEAVDDATSTMLKLRVAPSDLGKVIGKQGRTARSIRTILAAASMKAQHRYALDIQQVGDAPGTRREEADSTGDDD